MITLVDDGSLERLAQIEAALDAHWDAVEREIRQREIDRGGDLLETDRDLLRHIEQRRARRSAEIGGAS